MLNLPTHLSDPILQSLAYSIDVLTPLGTSFTRDEALYALKATRERSTFLSAAWNCLSASIFILFYFCFFIVCALIQHWWASGDDTCSPHCSLFMVKSGLSWGSTLAGHSILAFEHAAGFNLEDLGGEWRRGGEPFTSRGPLLILLFLKRHLNRTQFLQPNNVNYNLV